MSWMNGIGIELEYMIVDAASLEVRPIADVLLAAETGIVGACDAEHPDITWSNELVRHVIEVKTEGPTRDPLASLNAFNAHIAGINAHLTGERAMLLPTAMHPWMDPFTQTQLWPGENNEIYETYNRLFDCRGHGWSNLQSMHLNLPFYDDPTLGSLHAAIRLILPIIPAIAASSPFADGSQPGPLDYRMDVYRRNSARIPAMCGRVIPEPVYTEADYHAQIIQPIFDALKPHDPDFILNGDWVNSRGAIARFGRRTIEIRVIDLQECPAADIAIAGAIVAVIDALRSDRWSDQSTQRELPVATLAGIFERVIVDADAAVIDESDYLTALGWTGGTTTAGQLWADLVERVSGDATFASIAGPLETILSRGPLARRLVRALGRAPEADALRETYAELAVCLREGRQWDGQ